MKEQLVFIFFAQLCGEGFVVVGLGRASLGKYEENCRWQSSMPVTRA